MLNIFSLIKRNKSRKYLGRHHDYNNIKKLPAAKLKKKHTAQIDLTDDMHDDQFLDSAEKIRLVPRTFFESKKTKSEKRAVIKQYFTQIRQVDGDEAYKTIVNLFGLFGLSEEDTIDIYYQPIIDVYEVKKYLESTE